VLAWLAMPLAPPAWEVAQPPAAVVTPFTTKWVQELPLRARRVPPIVLPRNSNRHRALKILTEYALPAMSLALPALPPLIPAVELVTLVIISPHRLLQQLLAVCVT